jgi:hypothetical protein
MIKHAHNEVPQADLFICDSLWSSKKWGFPVQLVEKSLNQSHAIIGNVLGIVMLKENTQKQSILIITITWGH